tara:strand:- start:307 stop:459 length:153 start_codon:yes stop_codon:yes gene_type:complete
MSDVEFKVNDNGDKYVVWMEDLDIIVLYESDIREFQSEFDKMDNKQKEGK